MATRTRRGYRKDGRKRAPRRFGPAGNVGPSSKGPRYVPRSDRPDRAAEALTAILELFESGDLPERIEAAVLMRKTTDSPSAYWSLGNQLLCLLNGTSDARGFGQWKDVGRRVSKGAKAFYILAPLTAKRTETDAETGEMIVTPFVRGFKGVPVFRFEDTEGDALEYVNYDPPALPPLYDVARRLGLSVEYRPFVRDFYGCYCPSRSAIILCTHEERTFFHELAHAAHREVLRGRGEDLRPGQDARQETVAELTAAVLGRLFGKHYEANAAEYIRHYSGDGNVAKAAMRVLGDVQAVLAVILDGGEADATAVPLAA